MKFKNFFLFALCIAITNTPMAATALTTFVCPSVEEIKNHQFHYWLPLYIQNEEYASAADVAKFQQNVTEFVVARWNRVYLENGHCFYEGTDPILKTIIFAQDAWQPVQNEKWIWKDPKKLAECYSSNVKDCGFIQ